MVIVMKSVAVTAVPGVNVRVTVTAVDAMLLPPDTPQVKEVNTGAATMAATATAWVAVLTDDENTRCPAFARAPRVNPWSVMVTAEMPLGAPAVVMTIEVLVSVAAEAAVPVIKATDPTGNEAVPRK